MSGLSVSAGKNSDQTDYLDVSWDQVDNAETYGVELYRSIDGGGAYLKVKEVLVTGTSTRLSPLYPVASAAMTRYRVTVWAQSSAGIIGTSQTIEGISLAQATPTPTTTTTTGPSPDLYRPVVSLESIAPATVSVGDSVVITWTVTDETGVDSNWVSISHTSSGVGNVFGSLLTGATRVSGDDTNGTYQATVVVPTTAVGTYSASIYADDTLGNGGWNSNLGYLTVTG